MDRREFLKTAVAAAACATGLRASSLWAQAVTSAPAGGSARTAGMNVLFINIEDCNATAIGCYGNPLARTPNLDRLAASGIRFDRAYCQYPVCNASRSSYLTGLRPDTTGVLGNEYPMNEFLPAGTLTLPELFKAKGLWLADVGKLFHNTDGEVRQMQAFDRLEMVNRKRSAKPAAAMDRAGPIVLAADVQTPPPRDPRITQQTEEERQARIANSDRIGDSGLAEADEPDTKIANFAVDILRQCARDGNRFLLTVGSHRPHSPIVCPARYLALHDPAKVPLPPSHAQDRNVPEVARRFGRNFDIFVDREPTEAQTREAIAAYHACVTFLDAQLGRTLDELARLGLADRTIVIFTADHGYQLGEHGLWSKLTLFEQSARVPLIVRAPGAAGNGQACQRIVEMVDFVPTLCELSRLAAPKNLEGTSFVPLLAEPDRPWKKAAFTLCTRGLRTMGRSVRTERYRYNEWTSPQAVVKELYDLSADPWEQNNLADAPAVSAVRAELAALLKAGWRAALPPGT